MDRRRVLALLGSVVASPASARLGLAEEVAAFRDVIRAVGGVVALPEPLLEGCEREFAATFGLQALHDLGALARRKGTLAAMEDGAVTRVSDQLRWVARFLYTGETADGVAYYEWCLGWRALAFATAPGQCGGAFGHWVGPGL